MNYFVSLGIRMHQGRRTQDAGHRMQDTGCRTQDAGRRGNKITVSVYSTCLYIIYQEVMGFQM